MKSNGRRILKWECAKLRKDYEKLYAYSFYESYIFNVCLPDFIKFDKQVAIFQIMLYLIGRLLFVSGKTEMETTTKSEL
jgi:hypothetical protein